MSAVISALMQHAIDDPRKTALQDARGTLSYSDLMFKIESLAQRLRALNPRAIAILADNGRDWAVVDLAALMAGIPAIPIPPFFSSTQIAHTLRTAGVDHVYADQPARIRSALQRVDLPATPFCGVLQHIPLHDAGMRAVLPAGTSKVTFTSGTTGEPQGVCLGRETMETVALSLAHASEAHCDDRHLCLLPLATLLENIGGLYTPLIAGATVCLPGMAEVGLSDSSGLHVGRLIAALAHWQASTAIMVPHMLQALVAAAHAGAALPATLRYVAVGGAPVSKRLLEHAARLGLPVYQGYGLSECASVVAVSRPDAQRAGSVGQVLPHVRLAFADDGEILVHGVAWRGYLGAGKHVGEPVSAVAPIATGDLGYLDADGFLFLTGRKKNLFITAFGRNVAPEWVEGEMVTHPSIAQAALFGEARPFNCAVIVPRPGTPHHVIDDALNITNRGLPDYARVGAWIAATEAFTLHNGLSTPNGLLRRNAIHGRYADQINALYQS